MLVSIFGMLAKAGIGTIASRIADAYEAKQKATTDKEKIAADERIKTLEAKRDVLVSEAKSPINALIRVLFALPPAVYLAKIFVYDKVLGWGVTDPLSDELEQIVWIVLSFYFLAEITGRFARRK